MVGEARWMSANPYAVVGCCVVEGIAVGRSPSRLVDQLKAAAVSSTAAGGWDAGIRALLRATGFRPTGRNKPAHEFLARSGAELASISSIVDANNIISLRYRLPASVIDARACGGAIAFREGLRGERYVFNRSGQELDVQGLLVACAQSGAPIASPVKDSLAAHVTRETRDVVFCAYGSLQLIGPSRMQTVIDDFIGLGTEVAGGRASERWILSAPGEKSSRQRAAGT